MGDTDNIMHPNKTLVEITNEIGKLEDDANVLEVNFRIGAFATDLKYRHPQYNVEGLSTDQISAKYGMFTEKVFLRILNDKVDYIEALSDKKYDLIVINIDLDDEMGIGFYMSIVENHLKQDGKVIIALENCHHYSTWLPLITGMKPNKYISTNVVTVSDVQNSLLYGMNITNWWFVSEPETNSRDTEIRNKIISLMVAEGMLERDLTTSIYYLGITGPLVRE